MSKLTDTQLVILSNAAPREDGAVQPLPKSLKIKGAPLTKTLAGLHRKSLLEEKPAPRGAPSWREAEDGQRMMLVISDAGLKAIDGPPARELRVPHAPAKSRTKQPRAGRKATGAKRKGQPSAPATRSGTKQAMLIDLLKRRQGATIAELMKATGWQAHSVRGFLSGTLKKKLGLAIASKRSEGGPRRYRIES